MNVKNFSNSGFTLVEMLATLALASVLIGAIGGLLMGSSQVFKVLRARSELPFEVVSVKLFAFGKAHGAAVVHLEQFFDTKLKRGFLFFSCVEFQRFELVRPFFGSKCYANAG